MKTPSPLIDILITLREAELAEFGEVIAHSRFDAMVLARAAPEEWVRHAEMMQRTLEYGAAMPILYEELARYRGPPSKDNKANRDYNKQQRARIIVGSMG